MKISTNFSEYGLKVHSLISNEIEVDGIAGVEDPRPFNVIFIKEGKYLKKIATRPVETRTNIFVVTTAQFADEINCSLGATLLGIATTSNVMLSLAKMSEFFYKAKISGLDMTKNYNLGDKAGIATNAFIGQDVVIEEGATIHSGVTVMAKSIIKKGATIFPNVVIYPFVEIGEQTRIHSGTVIGADGFGYVFNAGVHQKIWHTGGVIIGSHVEIGANSCIDSGTFSPTLIGDKVIIDNQVQIGHNTTLGRGVIMCGQSGTAGSAHVGDYCVLGARAGVGNDITLGKACQIAGNAMVIADCEEGSKLGGFPARPMKEWLRSMAMLKKLGMKKDSE